MQLTIYTDYTLRVLIYLGVQPEYKRSNIKEIAEFYKISNNFIKGYCGFLHALNSLNQSNSPYVNTKGAAYNSTEEIMNSQTNKVN